VLAESTSDALATARRAGWKLVSVTNGRGPQQLAKIRNTGLDTLVDAWIISGDIGLQKPDPRTFAAAADAVGHPLDGAWMIGDSPHHDIAGAHLSALRSIWITTTTPWTEPGYHPTHITTDVASAIRYALAQDT
jgi:putative hydrolase of the HAD superfamily